jgi:hypothetical protein
MKLQVPYGKDGKLEAGIDEKCVLGIIEPNEVKIGDETEVIRQALANPIRSPSLKDFNPRIFFSAGGYGCGP